MLRAYFKAHPIFWLPRRNNNDDLVEEWDDRRVGMNEDMKVVQFMRLVDYIECGEDLAMRRGN